MITNMEINKSYKAEFDVDIVSGNANFKLINYADSEVFIDFADYADGHHVVYFDTDGDIGTGGFGFRASQVSSDNPFTLDNISVKEVL